MGRGEKGSRERERKRCRLGVRSQRCVVMIGEYDSLPEEVGVEGERERDDEGVGGEEGRGEDGWRSKR
jgi:hypothetical protein